MRHTVLIIAMLCSVPLWAHEGHGVPGLHWLIHYLTEPEHWMYLFLSAIVFVLLIRAWRALWHRH